MSAPPNRRPAQNNLRGAVLLTLAGAIFTFEVVLVRLVGTRATEAQIIFCRACAQLVLVGGWIGVAGRWGELRTARPGLHLVRGAVSILSWWLYYASFLALDLALATTLTFTTQLFVVALAGPVLGERVGPARVLVTLVGFAGVVIATGVGTVAYEPAVLWGVLSAVSGAAIVLLSRALTRTETTAAILFYIGLVTSLGALVPLLVAWRPIAPDDLALIVLAGACGSVGMAVMIEAFRIGEVSALAPVPYLRLVFALAAGYLAFGEVPTGTTLVGAVVVVLSALAVSHPRLRV